MILEEVKAKALVKILKGFTAQKLKHFFQPFNIDQLLAGRKKRRGMHIK